MNYQDALTDRLLDRAGDGDESAVQELMSMGLRSLPVIVIGEERLSGFNPAAIDEALAS